MERPFRPKFLKKIWDALDPQAGPPLEGDGLAAHALARPIFHVGILLALAVSYYFAHIGVKVLEGDEATYALLSKTISPRISRTPNCCTRRNSSQTRSCTSLGSPVPLMIKSPSNTSGATIRPCSQTGVLQLHAGPSVSSAA